MELKKNSAENSTQNSEKNAKIPSPDNHNEDHIENNPQSTRFTKLLFLVLLISVGFTVGVQIYKFVRQSHQPIDPHTFISFPQSKPIPEATLKVVGKGEVSSRQLLSGKWHLVYFGYTYCPDVCPVELTALHHMYTQLKQTLPKEKLPQVVFISIDPDRDTPEKSMKYVHYFDPDFMAATGNKNQLIILGHPLGIAWHKERNTNIQAKLSDKNYIMSHSTTILLVNPKGKVVGMFPAPHNPEKMVKVYSQLVNSI